jgi:proton glutamate symport protein
MTGRITLWLSLLGMMLLAVGFVGIGQPGTMDTAFAARWTGMLMLVPSCLKNKSLTQWILFSMVAGILLGCDFAAIGKELKVISTIFLKLIKSIIAPLLFGTLVVGIAGHTHLRQVGRMGLKALIYLEIVTTIALFIGLAAINITRAGEGIDMKAPASEEIKAPPPQSGTDIILHIFPENIAKSVAEGQVLQVVIFSLLFGMGAALVDEKKRRPVIEFCEGLSEVMFKFTSIIMYLAPFAVGAALAHTVATMGFSVLQNLLQLVGTLYMALIAFLLLVLVPVGLLIKLPFKAFIKAISEPVSIAFATTSSESALPKAMEAMEKLGVPRKVVSFVMPTGYSFNLDGTTLYLSLASVFVAQAAGIELSFEQQLLMVFTLMLTSKGVAGVPRASLVILLGTVAAFGLPAEPVFAILAVDSLMDMARTSVNVIGNCLATVVVAKWEGEFPARPEV